MNFDSSAVIALLVGIFTILSYIAKMIYNVSSRFTSLDLRLSHLEKNQQTIIRDIEKIENRVYK